MSAEDETAKRLRHLPARADYEVGYSKPPAATQFKPGVSGNPRGRPKGSKNRRPALNKERLTGIILEEAYRTIRVRDGEKSVTVPVAQAVVRSLAVNAAKGQHRAQKLFSELLSATEQANRRLNEEWLKTAIEYNLGWEPELERRRALGIVAPDPIPHPDDIEIDFSTETVRIKGPTTKEKNAQFEMLLEWRFGLEAELVARQQELVDDPEHPRREAIEETIAQHETTLAMIYRIMSEWNRAAARHR